MRVHFMKDFIWCGHYFAAGEIIEIDQKRIEEMSLIDAEAFVVEQPAEPAIEKGKVKRK